MINKWRVWDKLLRKFISWDSLPVHNFDSKDYIYQRCTGLWVNGFGFIYEGDIIELQGAPYLYLVVWDQWRWAIDSDGIVFDGYQSMTPAVYNRANIVGNNLLNNNWRVMAFNRSRQIKNTPIVE